MKTIIKKKLKSNFKFNLSRDDACISVWCAVSFIGLGGTNSSFIQLRGASCDIELASYSAVMINGTSITIFGPTLLDLADSVGVGIAELAAILFCRSIGSVVGAGGSGFIFDRFFKASLWMLCVDIFIGALFTVIIPVSPHIAVLGVLMFFHGFCFGALDNGVHAILMNVWKNKDTGPVMQLIHFTFAFGAFLSPLIAKPFISDNVKTDNIIENVSCVSIMNSSVFNSSCWNDVKNTCNDDGSGMSSAFVTHNCSNSSNDLSSSLYFGYAYWLSVIPLLVPLPPLIYYAVKKQCYCQMFLYKQRKESMQLDKEEETSDNKNCIEYPSNKLYRATLLILLFLFMALYVGIEVSFGTYIFAFAVKGNLQLSKQRAATLSSVFWGTFSFMRCFSILVSLFKTPPSLMMAGNLTGSILAATIMLIWHNNELAIWIGSGLLGTSCSAIYPTTMVWMTQHIPPTGKATGVLGTGAVVGDTLFPLLVGILLDKVAPESLVYYTFGGMAVCVILAIVMFIGTKVYLKIWRKSEEGMKSYQKLQIEDIELTALFDGEDELQSELNDQSSTESTVGKDTSLVHDKSED